MAPRFLPLGVATLALAALAGFGPAARAEPMSAETFMKAVDADADKTISMDELDAFAKKRFAELENDKDTTLDQKELKGRLTRAGMAMADTDKDKTVDEKEFLAYADTLFTKANKKGDKTLSVRELRSPAGKTLMTMLK